MSFDGNRAYTYDQNGNMTEYVSSDGKEWRKLYWDDENRLIRTQDNAGTVEYAYDEGGLRSRKKSALGETLYVNPQYSVRNGEVYSKHVFAGNTRLATTMVKRKGTAATELGVYYYHGDHLGSSNVITTKTGTFHEHLEYFPYGETWVHEKAAGSSEYMAHLFTGKELDPETGLYDHGARYRDPKLGGWLSVDPALLEYLPTGNKNKDSSLPGMGGVFYPVNLNLYHYAANNPLIFIDPDGNANILIVKDKNATGVLDSRALAFKNDTFKGVKFNAFQTWAKIKEKFGGSVGEKDAEFFLGKDYKSFDNFKTVSDNPKKFGVVAAGNVYDYEKSGWAPINGKSAYRLSDSSLGSGKVPQDSHFGNPIGKNPGDGGAHPSYVEGAHLHRAYGRGTGSQGCIIQQGFDGPGGLGNYLENNPEEQTGKVLIFR